MARGAEALLLGSVHACDEAQSAVEDVTNFAQTDRAPPSCPSIGRTLGSNRREHQAVIVLSLEDLLHTDQNCILQ